jgi:hypothetical protein
MAKSSTASMGPILDRSSLRALTPERRIVGRNLSKADVLLYRVVGRPVAVKDYAGRPFWVRHTLGRALVGRECRAYERAGAATGLAPFLGRLGPFTFATTWIESVPLVELPRDAASPEVFDRLDAIVAGLHERGVAICDLHHRDVLVAADGAVFVVDLAAAYVLPARPGAFRRSVFARLSAQDRLAVSRMRARFTGVPEDDALATLSPGTVRLWWAGRKIKSFWDLLRGKRT